MIKESTNGLWHACPRVARWWCAIILFKALYLACAFAALEIWRGDYRREFFQVSVRWPPAGGPTLESSFAAWDGAHYLLLATEGYAPGRPSCAFYPLWPMLMRLVSRATGIGPVWAGLAVSNLLSCAGWVLFFGGVERRWGLSAARWSLVLLVAFPGALFFQYLYSESLFFLLLMSLWLGLWEKRWRLAAAAAALLPLTRAVGVFAILPVFVHLWTLAPAAFRQALGAPMNGWRRAAASRIRWVTGFAEASSRSLPDRDPPSGSETAAAATANAPSARARRAMLLAPIAGWTAYLWLMAFWTGDALEGFTAQRFWGVHSIWNLIDLPKFLGSLLAPKTLHEFTGSLLDRLIFIGLVAVVPATIRVKNEFAVWIYWLGVLPAMSGSFTSFTRFASCAFPVFVALGSKCCDRGGTKFGIVLAAVFGVIHAVLVWRYSTFRWAG